MNGCSHKNPLKPGHQHMSHILNSLEGGYIGHNGKENGNYYLGFRV